MARQPRSRRLATAARWPAGILLTSWHYMWRTTPLSRREGPGSADGDRPPPLAGPAPEELQAPDDGVGPLFHRRYRVRIARAALTPKELVGKIAADLDHVAPTEFASFQKVRGRDDRLEVGDELVVRMPGPWDGPVAVVDVTDTSFRLATLRGHLEAGQIEFRAARRDGRLVFEIESWARSGDRLSNLLYAHLRMAKEIQLHMWTSFLEQVVRSAGGERSGRIEIDTKRVDVAP